MNRTGNNDLIQLVSFMVDSNELGINIFKIKEIHRISEITKITQAPSYVEGTMDLGGEVIPIINLRKRFNLEVKEYDKDTRIIFVHIKDNMIGMIVDSISEVVRLRANVIEASSGTVDDINSKYIKGVAALENCLLILLDLSKVIDIKELLNLPE